MNLTKTSQPNKKSLWALALLLFFFGIIIFFIFQTLFIFFLESLSDSPSSLHKWSEYYSLDDWNLAQHAYPDLDQDGQKDMITYTGCAFLSSVTEEQIPKRKQCREPEMSLLAFPESPNLIGQKLNPFNPAKLFGLPKSFLVLTKEGDWQYYAMNGLYLNKMALSQNHLFTPISPTLIDYIDLYQFRHLGIFYIFGPLW